GRRKAAPPPPPTRSSPTSGGTGCHRWTRTRARTRTRRADRGGAQLRLVRRRIRSIQSTKKITKAMELIAASRILKAQQRVEAARPYAELLTRAMEDVRRQNA